MISINECFNLAVFIKYAIIFKIIACLASCNLSHHFFKLAIEKTRLAFTECSNKF